MEELRHHGFRACVFITADIADDAVFVVLCPTYSPASLSLPSNPSHSQQAYQSLQEPTQTIQVQVHRVSVVVRKSALEQESVEEEPLSY